MENNIELALLVLARAIETGRIEGIYEEIKNLIHDK